MLRVTNVTADQQVKSGFFLGFGVRFQLYLKSRHMNRLVWVVRRDAVGIVIKIDVLFHLECDFTTYIVLSFDNSGNDVADGKGLG